MHAPLGESGGGASQAEEWMAPAMSGPEESNAALPIQLVRCPAGHYHVPGPCPICDGTAPVTAPTQAPTQAVAFPRRRSPLSWLFLFNVVTASLAVVAVAVAWVAIFHEPKRAPAESDKVRPSSAMEAATQPAPTAAPAAATPAAGTPPAATPTPTPPATAPSQPAGSATAPAPETGGETAIAATAPLSPAPLPVPRPASADAPPVDAAAAQQQAPNPALMAALQPQPPRSSLPLPQRLGVPPGVIQQVRWLDGRTIEILVRALDRQPDETDVIEERPSGDVVRARLRSGPRPCRYMEIYPAQRSNAFMLMRFCPDAMGRWMGQEIGGY